MESLATISTITLIHLLAVMSPGPDFFMAVRNSLTYSRKTGIWTAVGFGLGISVHILYCLAGLALIISKSILLFNFIKIAGAGYLIFIGMKSLLAKKEENKLELETKLEDISKLKAIKMGFLTNVLNPKATIFFLSLFTLIISPETPKSVLGIAGVIMVIDTVIWFSLVSIFLTQKHIRKVFEHYQTAFSKTFGAILVAFGIKVALTD